MGYTGDIVIAGAAQSVRQAVGGDTALEGGAGLSRRFEGDLFACPVIVPVIGETALLVDGVPGWFVRSGFSGRNTAVQTHLEHERSKNAHGY